MFFRAITEIPSLIFTIFYVIFEITEIPSAIYLITQFNLQKALEPRRPESLPLNSVQRTRTSKILALTLIPP